MRVFLAFAMMLALLAPAVAQTEDAPWQASITGQIEAFRAQDGAAALEFASEGFRTQFKDKPEEFYAAVIVTGYQPIVDSRSHTFGKFERLNENVVVQVVKFVGPDQALYEALYQLGNEPDIGWRVLGVALKKEAGIGI